MFLFDNKKRNLFIFFFKLVCQHFVSKRSICNLLMGTVLLLKCTLVSISHITNIVRGECTHKMHMKCVRRVVHIGSSEICSRHG